MNWISKASVMTFAMTSLLLLYSWWLPAFKAKDCTPTSILPAFDKISPSDVVYRESDSSLFVVSDNGKLVQMDLLGNILQKIKIGKYDLEAVALLDDVIVIGSEYPATVLFYDFSTRQIKKEINIQSIFDSVPLAQNAKLNHASIQNSGLESLVVINRTILVGRQADAVIFELNESLDLIKVHQVDAFSELSDLSAMHLFKNEIWFLFDKPKAFLAIKADDFLKGDYRVVRRRKFSTRGQEGIAVAGSLVVVAVDGPGQKDMITYPLECFL